MKFCLKKMKSLLIMWVWLTRTIFAILIFRLISHEYCLSSLLLTHWSNVFLFNHSRILTSQKIVWEGLVKLKFYSKSKRMCLETNHFQELQCYYCWISLNSKKIVFFTWLKCYKLSKHQLKIILSARLNQAVILI